MHPTSPHGSWHVVVTGESAESLAQKGGVPVEDFLEINGLGHASDVHPGLMVFVLEAEGRSAEDSQPQTNPGPQPSRPGQGTGDDGRTTSGGVPGAGGVFAWPLSHPRLSSPFGSRWGRPHEGIDLSTPPGTPVMAAADGVVAYAGHGIRGYGNLLVVAHDGGLMTVYAHNAVLSVRQGEHVKRGQVIAMSGQSGRATAPHLHFEVRRGESPIDPMPFLPPLKNQGQASP